VVFNLMIHQVLRTLEMLTVAATLSSLVYYALCLWSAARFIRDSKSAGEGARATQDLPSVSILKPLKGTDPEMYENFRSHCLQDYSDYEIIFGISDPDDPAVDLVERLKEEFPQHNIRLVHCPTSLGANTKVSNLSQMLAHARHEYIVVNDSDIRVPSDYLSRVVGPLADPKVGMVTCLYRGVAASTLGSRLESLGISTDFCAGVLVARQLEGIKFGLGSTLAFRRETLQAIGGFEVLADYLADDYQLGYRIAALGLKIELSGVVVESFLPQYTIRGFIDHQLRWARTVRDSRYWGYLGLGATFGLFWAILAVILAHGASWAWVLLTATVAMRLAVGLGVGQGILHDIQVLQLLAWLPLRDALAFLVWVGSFAGHTVIWRGTSYTLKRGKLARMTL
jgi:ceramide glucosyltransferase